MSLNPGLTQRYLFFQATRETITDFTYRKYGPVARGDGGVQTSGSSTTVSSMSGIPFPAFSALKSADLIQFVYAGVRSTVRKVSTWTDANNIVISGSAVDYSNGLSSWQFWKESSGTTDADGWVFVGPDANRTVIVDVSSFINANGVTVSIEGKVGHGLANAPIVLYQQTLTASGQNTYAIGEDVEWLRVGVKAADLPTDPDVFDIYISKRAVR